MSEEISQFWLWRGTQPWTRGPRAQRLYPPQVASGGGTRQSALPRLSPGRRAAREGGGGARRELSWAPQAGRQAGGLRAEHCSGWQPERPSPRPAIRPALVHCLTSPSGLSGGCPAPPRSREAAAAQETPGAWGEPRCADARGTQSFGGRGTAREPPPGQSSSGLGTCLTESGSGDVGWVLDLGREGLTRLDFRLGGRLFKERCLSGPNGQRGAQSESPQSPKAGWAPWLQRAPAVASSRAPRGRPSADGSGLDKWVTRCPTEAETVF